MLKIKNKAKWVSSISTARANGLRPLGLACYAAGFLLLSACTVIPRLDARFDADPLGVPPSTPAPTPPNDDLGWRTGFVTSSIVNEPAGGALGARRAVAGVHVIAR